MALAFALIHSPLVGPGSWEPVAEALRGRGMAVAVPELAQPPAAPFWQQQAAEAAVHLEALPPGRPVLLAGHSGAGALLPAIRARAPRPVAGVIFVDAGIPRAGERRAGKGDFAAALQALYAAGGRFPSWTDDDLRARPRS